MVLPITPTSPGQSDHYYNLVTVMVGITVMMVLFCCISVYYLRKLQRPVWGDEHLIHTMEVWSALGDEEESTAQTTSGQTPSGGEDFVEKIERKRAMARKSMMASLMVSSLSAVSEGKTEKMAKKPPDATMLDSKVTTATEGNVSKMSDRSSAKSMMPDATTAKPPPSSKTPAKNSKTGESIGKMPLQTGKK